MKIYFNLDSRQFVIAPSSSIPFYDFTFIRSADASSIDLSFVRNGEVVELDSGTTGILGFKEVGKFDEDYVVSALSWVKSGTGEDTIYSFSPLFNTEALDELLFVDGDENNDKASIQLNGQIRWVNAAGKKDFTPVFVSTVLNNVVRGDEGLPDDPDPEYYNADEVKALVSGFDVTAKSIYFSAKFGVGATIANAVATSKGTLAALVNVSSFVNNYATIIGGVGAFGFSTYGDGRIVWGIGGLFDLGHFTPVLNTGVDYHLAVTFDNAAGFATFYINGEEADTITWVPYGGTISPHTGVGYSGDGSFNGRITLPQIYNYVLSSGEVAELFKRGGALKVTDRGGSNTSRLVSAWSSNTGSGTVTSANGASLQIASSSYKTAVSTGFSVKAGQRFLLKGTCAAITNGPLFLAIQTATLDANLSDYESVSATGDFSIEFTATGNDPAARIWAGGSGAGSGTVAVTLTGLSLIPLGALVAIDDASKHCGFQVADISGNNKHLNLPASGVSIVSPSRRGQIIYTLAASYPVRVSYIPPYSYIDSIFLSGGADDPVIFIGTAALDIDNIAEGVTLSDFAYVESFTGRLAHSGEIWAMNDTNDDPVTIVISFTKTV